MINMWSSSDNGNLSYCAAWSIISGSNIFKGGSPASYGASVRCIKDFTLPDVSLSVTLSTFTVSTNRTLVSLTWRTETEINNYGFEIERKSENVSWQKIGFIEGHGTSDAPHDYQFTDKVLQTEKYCYRLKQIYDGGNYEYSTVEEADVNAEPPQKYALHQNYPNPFNPSTTIEYDLPIDTHIKIVLFDLLGKQVRTLVDEDKSAGSYEIEFDATGLTNGIYFYSLQTGEFTQTKKLLLLR
jgi:hypothetical protein